MDLSELWAKAQTDNFNALNADSKQKFEPVPTGTYQAVIEKASLDLSRTPHQVSVWYKVTEGEFDGRKLFANFSLNEVGTGILKKELTKLGYTGVPKSYEELESTLTKTVGTQCEVYAKHRTYPKKDGTLGDAHNVYINSAELAQTSDMTKPLDTSEKLPF